MLKGEFDSLGVTNIFSLGTRMHSESLKMDDGDLKSYWVRFSDRVKAVDIEIDRKHFFEGELAY